MEQALQGLSIKTFDEIGKSKLEIMFFKIVKAGCPRRECQSDIDVFIVEAKARDRGFVDREIGHS
jgi:hypothetical protein